MAQPPRLGIYQRKNFDPLRGGLGAPRTPKNLKSAFFRRGLTKIPADRFFFFLHHSITIDLYFLLGSWFRYPNSIEAISGPTKLGHIQIRLFQIPSLFLDYVLTIWHPHAIKKFWRYFGTGSDRKWAGNEPEMGQKWTKNGLKWDMLVILIINDLILNGNGQKLQKRSILGPEVGTNRPEVARNGAERTKNWLNWDILVILRQLWQF